MLQDYAENLFRQIELLGFTVNLTKVYIYRETLALMLDNLSDSGSTLEDDVNCMLGYLTSINAINGSVN